MLTPCTSSGSATVGTLFVLHGFSCSYYYFLWLFPVCLFYLLIYFFYLFLFFFWFDSLFSFECFCFQFRFWTFPFEFLTSLLVQLSLIFIHICMSIATSSVLGGEYVSFLTKLNNGSPILTRWSKLHLTFYSPGVDLNSARVFTPFYITEFSIKKYEFSTLHSLRPVSSQYLVTWLELNGIHMICV